MSPGLLVNFAAGRPFDRARSSSSLQHRPLVAGINGVEIVSYALWMSIAMYVTYSHELCSVAFKPTISDQVEAIPTFAAQ